MRIRTILMATMFTVLSSLAIAPTSEGADNPGGPGGEGGGSSCWGCETTPLSPGASVCDTGFLVGRTTCSTEIVPFVGTICKLGQNRCVGGKDMGPAPGIG